MLPARPRCGRAKNMVVGMLTALGASALEDQVYCFVAATVSASGAEIRSNTGLGEDEVREARAGLRLRGLISQTPDDPVRFIASSPGTVESMIASRLHELREAQQVLDGIAAKRRAGQQGGGAAGGVGFWGG